MLDNLLAMKWVSQPGKSWGESIVFAVFMFLIAKGLSYFLKNPLLLIPIWLLVKWFILKQFFGVRNPIIVMVVSMLISITLIIIFGALVLGLIGVNVMAAI